jgi:DNA-directed RNA polymerase subunit K/omega
MTDKSDTEFVSDNDDYESEEENEYISDEEEMIDEDNEEELVDKDCLYNKILKEDLEEEDNFEKIVKPEPKYNILRGKDRISFPRMTRYELVRIIGERTKQLTMGAKAFIKNKEDYSYEELAVLELKNKLVPFKIMRTLPNGDKEEWSIDELSIEHLF